jgi:methionyl-tRNA formyltransferase
MISSGLLKSHEKLRLVFMGTPDFAVESLKSLIQSRHDVMAVVTAADKPAGRGRIVQTSPVKEYALHCGLPVLQPPNLKDHAFLDQLASFKPDLQVVVAFRMLPEAVWKLPVTGTINLHASLLPQYRGAAPINWAIINGEKKTGVTTFFINQEIDTGEILFQKEIDIFPEDTAGLLHDRLKAIGAALLVETVDAIASGNYHRLPQPGLKSTVPLRTAPKINREDCRVRWSSEGKDIVNFIRGLSPLPAAWSTFKSADEIIPVKIFAAEWLEESHGLPLGMVLTDHKSCLRVAVKDGFLAIKELQLPGKKRLSILEFLNGFSPAEECCFI